MVFSQSYKMSRDGKRHPLSVSQVKQIAGRAGRYGLHAPTPRSDGNVSRSDTRPTSSPPGLVTSVMPKDLPFLRRTLSITPPPISTAIISPTSQSLLAASELVKPSHAQLGQGQRCQSYLVTLADAHRYTAQTLPWLRYSGFDTQDDSWEKIAVWLEEQEAKRKDLGAFDFDTVFLFFTAPLPLRDTGALAFCNALFRIYKEDLHVPIQRCLLEGLPDFEGGFIALLERSELALGLVEPVSTDESPSTDDRQISIPKDADKGSRLPSFALLLQKMETLHSALSMYVWLTYRRPTSFSGMAEAQDLMPRVQKVIEALLSRRAAVASKLNIHDMETQLHRAAPSLDIEYSRDYRTKRLLQDQRAVLFKGLQDAKRKRTSV